MTISRRGFLSTAACGAVALSVPDFALSAVPRRALRILVLGGTGFISPHVVQRALDRGHTVTLFNRGRTNTHLFPEAEKLVGDRNGQLDALRGGRWDVVIDNSGYYPSHVRASAELLHGSVDHYLFTSTIDAYQDFRPVGLDESHPIHPADPSRPEDPSRYYGPLKADCERIVRGIYGSDSTSVRPGWIAGPGDNNHLLTYWVVRIARGGEVLAPGTPDDFMQVTDVRDLAEWYLHIAEERVSGAFSAVGPVLGWGDTLERIRAAVSSDARLTWVDADFLLERDQKPWTDIPLWWPARNDWGPRSFGGNLGGEGAFAIDGALALANGFSNRTLEDTSVSTLDWYRETFDDWPEDSRPGFTAEQERRLLAEWNSRSAPAS